MAQQLSAKEPTAEQIAEQKIYKQIGVTDQEYELICGFLGRQAELYRNRRIQRNVVRALLLQKFQASTSKKFPIRASRSDGTG